MLSALLLIAGLAGCSRSTAPLGIREVALGEMCLRIPEFNARANDASPFPPFGAGTPDSNRAITLQFLNEAVVEDIPEYRIPLTVQGQPRTAMLAMVMLATPEELEKTRHAAKYFGYEIWYGMGAYEGRAVEAMRGTNWYRVYPIAGGRAWNVVTEVPDQIKRDTHLHEGFWIASCSRRSAGARCLTSVADQERDLVIDLHIAEENLPLRDKLAAYVAAHVEEWRMDCEAGVRSRKQQP